MIGNCEICHRFKMLERHHVFAGIRRPTSEKYGAVALVCHSCHMDIHDHPSDYRWLQANWQRRVCEEQGWSTEDFVRKFGKNYGGLPEVKR